MTMHMPRIWPALALLAMTAALAQEKAPALRLHGFLESLEIAPVLLAADRHYPAGISLKRGGIQNLYGVVSPAYGDAGTADVATNAETQLLRYSVAHPELRAIMTVTEGRYRIVARRSAGIVQLRDLRGKRVGTLPNTSAAWFLERMLGSVGLAPSDVVTVGNIDLPELSAALVDGRIDALAMWSPESEEAELALGKDAVGFDGAGIYREIFNLNTTAQALADPGKRAAIKQLLRALITANAAMMRDSRAAQSLVVTRMSVYPPAYSPAVVAASWPHHHYVAGKVPDLLDVMVEEEKWLARTESRMPRQREALARLIDYTLLDEVLAEPASAQVP
jgi:NitT/TauT family transport system substrate-binding protein